MHRAESRDPASTPWASNLGAEPSDVQRFVVGADGVERLVPGGQELAGRRVEVAAGCLVPDGQVRVVVLDLVGGWPPHLVVGRGEHLPQLGAGHGAADRHVNVRGEPPLWLDGGEVLEVVADQAAQVLDQPVEQRGEVQRVSGGALVVVGGRVGRDAVRRDLAVAVAGQGQEHRRTEGLAVRGGVGLADRPGIDSPAGQVGGVLAAPGGSVASLLPVGQDVAAHAGAGDFLVQLGGQLVQLGRRLVRPSVWAWSCICWESARWVTQVRCTSSGSSGVITGSVSRCQPSRHCAARRVRARSAQAGQTEARVCPHGMSTCSTWPVCRSVRRSCTGRMQPPCSAARSRTTSRASGMASRWARVVRWVMRSPFRRGRHGRRSCRGRWRAR